MANAQILVVEDEDIVAMDVQTSLKNLGYAVPITVSSGEEAIKKAQETHSDLVLMDIRLKGDMDGVEAAEQIHACSNIPVVYLTAYADERTLERVKTTESYGCILKPFQERELRASIEVALYKYKTESKLKEKEKWLAATLKSIGDAVITTDIKGMVSFMNPAAEILTGWKQEDALGKDLTEVFNIINGKTGVLIESPAVKALREGAVMKLEDDTLLIAKDGTKIPILDSAAPIRDDKEDITGAVLVFRQLTEQNSRRESVRASVEKYRAVIEKTKVRRGMPVVLTEEEVGKLQIQPKLKEIYYLKDLKKRKRQKRGSLKRIENQIFNARRNYAIIALLYSSGIRLAELANLDLADIHLRERQLSLWTKGDNESYCPLTPEIGRFLRSYIEARGARGNVKDQLYLLPGLVRGSRKGISKELCLNMQKRQELTKGSVRIR